MGEVLVRFAPLLMSLALLAAACGGEDEPELTTEEQLELIEGRPLTAVEVTDLLNVASALCDLDEPVLDAVWQRLSTEQLEFQDFVFSETCPERSVFYAGLTGRYVTDEAVNSGVVTSTTRPPSTTTSAEPVEPSSATVFPPMPTTTAAGGAGEPADGDSGVTGDGAGDPSDTESSDLTEVTPPDTDVETETTPPEGEGG